jgi:nucleotide-binding universal stress UspA family protein
MNPFKILFATNFHSSALDSLKSLLSLRRAGLEEIILTHIIPREEVAFVPFGGYLKNREVHLEEEARLCFADWQKFLVQHGVRTRVVIEVGEPISNIVKLAEAKKATLIVAGHKKTKDGGEIRLGSHIFDLLRRSRVIPILINNPPEIGHSEDEGFKRLTDALFSRPLLATDWSNIAQKALEFVPFLREVIDRVDLVHVLETNSVQGWEKKELRLLETKAQRRLIGDQKFLEKGGIRSDTHLRAGKPVEEIIRLSNELKSTVIILGTTGKNRLGDFFLGSISHRLVEKSPLPTLLIP